MSGTSETSPPLPNSRREHAGTWLPEDAGEAVLFGRIWHPERGGPIVVAVRGEQLIDLSALAPTVAELLADPARCARVARYPGEPLARLDALLPTWHRPEPPADAPQLLAPIDLQCIKACGVTFALSLIEERSGGRPEASARLRRELETVIGRSLRQIRPGTAEAARLEEVLRAAGMWSPYIEVAIGPHAEVFTKVPVLAAVGAGAQIGVRSDSRWNNPEPEIVLVCDPAARPVAATLGNDVNLRDFEGRSALLLGQAKDNTGSCAIGPFLRLFDARFTLNEVRAAGLELEITGPDGFHLAASGRMCDITRDPLELVAHCAGPHHQYPDGFALFLGTPFVPIADRECAGKGFTHHPGDEVRIRSPRLGTLVNRVDHCERLPPWTFGLTALMRYLASRPPAL